MQTTDLISVREYLATTYRPDCDFVDGVVVERNVGEKDHGKLQRALIVYFHERRKKWGVSVFPEQRVQVAPTRFRVPGVCVVLGPEPEEQVFTAPPFICIEILSPEDRLAAMQEKVRDYLKMGVPYVWIVNPATREAFRCTFDGLQAMEELHTDEQDIVIPVDDLFED
jgi:Uma2 family endonuclease